MYGREGDYKAVVDALVPVLHDLPGKIVAIDGRPGVGKTTLGRFLAWRFNVSLIETDLFLIEHQGRFVYRNCEIVRIVDKRLRKPRPIIIEGAAVLRLLTELRRKADFTVYITNKDAPQSLGDAAADLASYETQFDPPKRADITIELQGCR